MTQRVLIIHSTLHIIYIAPVNNDLILIHYYFRLSGRVIEAIRCSLAYFSVASKSTNIRC